MENTFIFAQRGREHMKEGVTRNINKFYPDSQIIFVNQCNDALFQKGQLMNLAINVATTPVIITQDIDVRHFHPLNFQGLLNEINHPFIGFNCVREIKENEDFSYETLMVRDLASGHHIGSGHVVVATQKMIYDACGYSNLLFGWGGEDNEFQRRAKLRRIVNTTGHVSHSSIANRGSAVYKNLLVTLEMMKKGDILPKYDGILQTRGEYKIKKNGNIIEMDVYKTGVAEDYKYMDLYRELVNEKC